MEYRKYKKLILEARIWKELIPNSIFNIQYSTKKGFATLPTVMVLGVMSLAVAVGITAVALTESFISQGGIQSNKALFYAESGARDALIRIARNKGFSTTTYSIDFTTNGTGCSGTIGGCATIAVSATTNPKFATSTGQMGASIRTIVASSTIDTDGLIATTTWSEVTN